MIDFLCATDDTNLIMKSISVTEVKFKREDSNTFIMVTPEGKLKAAVSTYVVI